MKTLLLALTLLTSASAFAAPSNFTLSCDDNNIFENPMIIKIRGANATAEGNFSGPGDAIFNVNQKNIDVLDLQTDRAGNLESVTLTTPRVVRTPVQFQLTLKADARESLSGEIQMTSTDSDKMPYSGKISCSVK